MTTEERSPPPLPGSRRARVVACRLLASHVLSVQLRVLADSIFRYREGQYIRVHLADGRRRDLSIANPCADDNLIEVWVRDVGGDFSRYLFDRLVVGEVWTFDGPMGGAWVRDDDRPLLIVAGGTGLGPAQAIVRAELAQVPDRSIELIHGAATREHLLVDDAIQQWARAHPAFTYLPILDSADADWSGHRGTPDDLIAARHDRLDGWCAHLFGPPPMVEAVDPLLRARGLPPDAIHADAFTPGASDLDRQYPSRS